MKYTDGEFYWIKTEQGWVLTQGVDNDYYRDGVLLIGHGGHKAYDIGDFTKAIHIPFPEEETDEEAPFYDSGLSRSTGVDDDL